MKKVLYKFCLLLIGTLVINSCAPIAVVSLPKPIGPKAKNQVIKDHFENTELDLIEGIWVWDNNAYEIAIIKNTFSVYPQYDYVGLITDTRRSNWGLGEVKLLLKKTVSNSVYAAVYMMGNKSEYGSSVILSNDNLAEIQLPTGAYGTKQTAYLMRMYPSRDSNSIKSEEGFSTLSGTGFFISNEIIATNYHVIANAKEITLNWNNKKYNANLLIKDELNDLALLKISFSENTIEEKLFKEQIDPFPMGNIRAVTDGDKVFTIGFPLTNDLGKRARVGEGIINSTVGIEDDPRMFQISIPIQPGNSGSPLLDDKGNAVGVVTSTINNAYLILQKGTFPQNVNFSVKINYLNNLISLLPIEPQLPKVTNSKVITASQLMDRFRNSVVLIESKL